MSRAATAARMRARRALELQTELRAARRMRQPIAVLLAEWRKLHRRITRAAARLNAMLGEEPIEFELMTPSELRETVQPLLYGPSNAIDELRAQGRAIAKMEPVRVRKAKAELKKYKGHWSSIEAALKAPEALRYRWEAHNEIRRLEGKAPLSLEAFTELLRAQLELRAKHRRRAKGEKP